MMGISLVQMSSKSASYVENVKNEKVIMLPNLWHVGLTTSNELVVVFMYRIKHENICDNADLTE